MALNDRPDENTFNNRQYVAVKAVIDENCKMNPLSLTWTNDFEYEIDRVLDVCHTAQLKTGGTAFRYTVRIHGRQRYLFFDPHDFRWFVEVEPERLAVFSDYGA